jgi:hypothetical protein
MRTYSWEEEKQGWEPIHQKYKANENTSRHNPRKKQKLTINKKSGEDHMQRGLLRRDLVGAQFEKI